MKNMTKRMIGKHEYIMHREYKRSIKPNPHVDRAMETLQKKGYMVALTRSTDHYTVWKRKPPRKIGGVTAVDRSDKVRSRVPKTFMYYKKRYQKSGKAHTHRIGATEAAKNLRSMGYYKIIVVKFRLQMGIRYVLYERSAL